jgi:VanZ family protein
MRVPAAVRIGCALLAAALVLGLLVPGARPVAVGLVPSPWDKLAHVALFGALGAFLAVAANARRPALVAAALAFVAVADEALQTVQPGRHADLVDLACDFAGVAAGVIAATALLARRDGARGGRG